MTRIATGNLIRQKPTNNIYTVLTLAALVVVLLGLGYVLVRASTIFPGGLF
jgi:hypothetical protein